MRRNELEGRDELGRRFPNRRRSTGKCIAPRVRDQLLFERLLWHGPLPAPYLVEYSRRFGYKSIGRVRDRLTDLFHETNTPHGGQYLDRPLEQFPNLPGGYVPRNQTLVYSLNDQSRKALAECGRMAPGPYKGWWHHQLQLACVTASLELSIMASGGAFIPRHELVGGQALKATAPIVHEGTTYSGSLIPDQLFGIRFPTGRLGFLVEMDRATEPVSDRTFKRKSFLRSALQYRTFIGQRSFREHFGLDIGMLVLFVTTSQRQVERMIETVLDVTGGKGNNYLLFKALPELAGRGRTPTRIFSELHTEPWLRAGYLPFSLQAGR